MTKESEKDLLLSLSRVIATKSPLDLGFIFYCHKYVIYWVFFFFFWKLFQVYKEIQRWGKEFRDESEQVIFRFFPTLQFMGMWKHDIDSVTRLMIDTAGLKN